MTWTAFAPTCSLHLKIDCVPSDNEDFAGINKHFAFYEKSHLLPSCLSCQQTLKSSVALAEPTTGRKESKAIIMIPNRRKGRGGATETASVKLLKLSTKEPAVLMDCAIVCLQINSHFQSSEICSEESNWRAERMQSKVSEGSVSSFLPINCRHCLTQLVVIVKCTSHSILLYGTGDGFDSPYCPIL